MLDFSRRKFLAGAATAALAGRYSAASETAGDIIRGTDIVKLGPGGIKTSVLGVGTGTRGGREQLGLGQKDYVKMMRHAYDRGIRYIDTADRYKTHIFTRFALEELPRDEIFLQTKTWGRHAEVAKADIDRFLRELGTKYIDSLLIHCMMDKNWPTDLRPMIDVVLKAKEQGKVRSIGVSCHGWDPLVDSVGCDWVDNHLVRINPEGIKMDGKASDVAGQIAKMHDKGRGVIGMKVYGEGAFTTREKRLESLKYVLGLGTVDAFTIGFGNTDQIDETLDLIEEAAVPKRKQTASVPLTDSDLQVA